MYKKILFATDGSLHSNIAAEHIVELQKNWDCEVVVFHSMKHTKYLSTLYPDINLLDYRNIKKMRKELGKEILEQTKKIFDKANISVELRLIKDERYEDYIKRIVKVENFDLVVLSCYGHHPKIKNTFLGTRSSKVLKFAPCNVLIVR